MPVVLRFRGCRFFFYSNEGNPLEPAHIHVRDAECEAKLWLMPEVWLAYNDGFSDKMLKVLMAVTQEHHALFLEAWNDYFG